MHTINVNGTTFSVRSSEYESYTEFPGDCHWTFPASMALLLADVKTSEQNFGGSEVVTSMAERHENACGDEYEHGEPMQLDADGAFAALAWLSEQGATWTDDEDHVITWEGDNAYWIYHDASHAIHEATVDGNSVYLDPVNDGSTEDRANVDGAVSATRDGFPIADTIRALSSAAEVFSERFGYQSYAIETFFSSHVASVELID